MKVVSAPNDESVKIVLIEGELPTSAEWEEILAGGYYLNVLWMPEEAPTLEGLFPIGDRLRRLSVNSYSCSDLRGIDQFPNLEELSVGGRVTHGPTLKEAARLTWFGGPLRRFEGVLDLPTITGLRVDLGGKRPPSISAPVTDLTLSRARGIEELNSLVENPEMLEKLVIEGAKTLDLRGLSAMTNLTTLEFERCGRLEHGSAIRNLAKLRKLIFEDCPQIEDYESLLSLEATTHVISKNPFDQAFRSAAPPSWSFPPGKKYLPRDQGT